MSNDKLPNADYIMLLRMQQDIWLDDNHNLRSTKGFVYFRNLRDRMLQIGVL